MRTRPKIIFSQNFPFYEIKEVEFPNPFAGGISEKIRIQLFFFRLRGKRKQSEKWFWINNHLSQSEKWPIHPLQNQSKKFERIWWKIHTKWKKRRVLAWENLFPHIFLLNHFLEFRVQKRHFKLVMFRRKRKKKAELRKNGNERKLKYENIDSPSLIHVCTGRSN